jgi:diguanylate cyclase (GGDEF)-like protein
MGGVETPEVCFMSLALACATWMCASQARNHDLQRRELGRVSRSDPLTGCLNRRGFEERFAAELSRAARSGAMLSVVLLDLDDFKRVNDEHGHPAGDDVLRSVAAAAAGVARQGDCVARVGGDEFALLAPGAGASGVLRLLRDLRDAIEHPATFAAGLVPDDARTPEELVAHADARLLAQKRDGKLRQPILSVRGA